MVPAKCAGVSAGCSGGYIVTSNPIPSPFPVGPIFILFFEKGVPHRGAHMGARMGAHIPEGDYRARRSPQKRKINEVEPSEYVGTSMHTPAPKGQ